QTHDVFEHHKAMGTGKWVKFVRRGDKKEAYRLIEEAMERATAKKA
ncbi:inorganic pyrophosphatase, partial [Methylobacterium sp. E-066]|nr:inorganic pyrophosphatase [Methylobacterium sp. E-066]